MFDLAFINDWLFNFFIIVSFLFIFSVVDNLWQSAFGLTIFYHRFYFEFGHSFSLFKFMHIKRFIMTRWLTV